MPDNAKVILGPPPAGNDNGGGGETSSGFIAYAPGYHNIISRDNNCTLSTPACGFNTGNGGQLTLTLANKNARTCTFELYMPNSTNLAGVFMLKLNLPDNNDASASLDCTQVNDVSKSCKALPNLLTTNGSYQIYMPMAKNL